MSKEELLQRLIRVRGQASGEVEADKAFEALAATIKALFEEQVGPELTSIRNEYPQYSLPKEEILGIIQDTIRAAVTDGIAISENGIKLHKPNFTSGKLLFSFISGELAGTPTEVAVTLNKYANAENGYYIDIYQYALKTT